MGLIYLLALAALVFFVADAWHHYRAALQERKELYALRRRLEEMQKRRDGQLSEGNSQAEKTATSPVQQNLSGATLKVADKLGTAVRGVESVFPRLEKEGNEGETSQKKSAEAADALEALLPLLSAIPKSDLNRLLLSKQAEALLNWRSVVGHEDKTTWIQLNEIDDKVSAIQKQLREIRNAVSGMNASPRRKPAIAKLVAAGRAVR